MHHTRRKSGHASANGSMTDVRKAVSQTPKSRPAAMSRKSGPQPVHKLGKNPRDREREWEEERHWEEERESFPQFCMTCEKQFVPQDELFLYCSESCRKHDQSSALSFSSSSRSHTGYSANHPLYGVGSSEPRDIVPRASPSRPHSTYFSPPSTPEALTHSAAISALKSLTTRPPSPPSPTVAGSAVWPLARSVLTASPGSLYAQSASPFFSSTYDSPYAYNAMGADRPLPSRRPGAYSRPKSIELVTPMVGR